jgi:hypothetical protein
MVPGFIDNHAHFQEEGAYWTMELRFDGMDTRKKVLDAIAAKAKATPNGGWVYNLGGWSPDQFSDDKREFTREELDKVAPNNPVFLQFTRWAQYLNSKAIEQLGLDKMTEPWIERDASGRPTGITRVAGRNILFNKAGFLKTENGGKAELPMDVIKNNQKLMLKDFAIAGLTASGGQCLWDDLYRQFQREGTRACASSASAPSKPADAAPASSNGSSPKCPSSGITTATSGWTNANYGERFPGGGGGDVLAPGPEPIASQEAWDQWGRFGLEAAKAGVPVILHTVTEKAIDAQLDQVEKIAKTGRYPAAALVVHAHGSRHAGAGRADEEAQHVPRHQPARNRVGRTPPSNPGRQGVRDAAAEGDPGRGIMWASARTHRSQPVPSVPDAVLAGDRKDGRRHGRQHAHISREAALIAHTAATRTCSSARPTSARFSRAVRGSRRHRQGLPDGARRQIKDIKSVLTIVGGRIVYDASKDAPSTSTR